MKLFFVLTALFLGSASMTQADGWRVLLSTSTLLITTEENPEKNIVTVPKDQLTNSGAMTVAYSEKVPEKDWKREISVVDGEGNELTKRGNNKLVVTHNQLKSIVAKGINTFHFYSWTLPTDPDKAALVRVRRVHLCTIIVK